MLSSVHSVMRVKSVVADEGGGCTPTTSKVAVYAPAEWADTLTLFHLYQYMYSVGSIFRIAGYTYLINRHTHKIKRLHEAYKKFVVFVAELKKRMPNPYPTIFSYHVKITRVEISSSDNDANFRVSLLSFKESIEAAGKKPFL